MKKYTCFLVLLACFGCSQSEVETSKPSIAGENQQQTISPTVARVNDQIISQAELNFTIQQTLGDRAALLLTEDVRQQLLQSLIIGQLMSQQASKQLSFEEIQQINLASQAYKNELLAKAYIQRNISPSPVSSEMVESYYKKHPEEFGGGFNYSYQQLTVGWTGDDQNRDQVLQQLANINNNHDWKALEKTFVQAGAQVELIQRTTQKALPLLRNLQSGETSSVSISGSQAIVARLINKEQRAVRPLTNVSDLIRKKLLPAQLREAIQAESELLRSTASIEIIQ